jgi:hypothetical protein
MLKKIFSLKKLWIIPLFFILFLALIQGLEQLLDSCKRFNVPIKILGLGLPYRGNSEKLLHMKKFLNTLPDNDIVLFVDAYDILFMNTKKEILKRFLAMKAPFVISVDGSCWPLADKAKDFPPSPTPFRFINSGSYIGYVKAIKDILGEMTNINPYASDQAKFTLHYLDHREKYTFDYYCQLFMPVAWLSDRDLEINQKNFTLKCKSTDTFPCIIHGNGRGIYFYQYIYDYLFIHNPYFEQKEFTLDRYLYQKGKRKIDGNYYKKNAEQLKFLSDLVKNPNISTIGEIGFNAGHFSDLFLKNNKKVKIYSFDIVEHPYTIYGKEYIDLKYPKSHKLIERNSSFSIPHFDKNIKFDLIFINGKDAFTTTICDIINMRFYADKDTILIINNLSLSNIKKAWQYCVDNGIITPGKHFSSESKSWQQCKYIDKKSKIKAESKKDS